MDALQILTEANLLCEKFSSHWFNRYAAFSDTNSAAVDLVHALEFDLEFERSSASDGSPGSARLFSEVDGVYVSITIDRAGGDGPSATAWACVHDLEASKRRISRAAAQAKALETRQINAETAAVLARLESTEAELSDARARVAALSEASHSAQLANSARAAAPAKIGSDRFQLIELD
jgi:hypothetical protein